MKASNSLALVCMLNNEELAIVCITIRYVQTYSLFQLRSLHTKSDMFCMCFCLFHLFPSQNNIFCLHSPMKTHSMWLMLVILYICMRNGHHYVQMSNHSMVSMPQSVDWCNNNPVLLKFLSEIGVGFDCANKV